MTYESIYIGALEGARATVGSKIRLNYQDNIIFEYKGVTLLDIKGVAVQVEDFGLMHDHLAGRYNSRIVLIGEKDNKISNVRLELEKVLGIGLQPENKKLQGAIV
jgi:hypothetical protein